MFACIHAPEASSLGGTFSPCVEMVDSTTAVFSLSPRQLAEFALKPPPVQAAVASSAEAAILAARHLPGFTFIEPGREEEILGPLPIDVLQIDVLPPDVEVFETLDRWGIRTLADFARLPQDGLAERLGDRGLWLQNLARGALDRPLRVARAAQTYQESAEMEHPIELREPLLFLIGRYIFDLSARLKSQSLAAEAVRLILNDQERALNLPFPTRDVKLLVKLVEHSLERQPPEEPIRKIRVELIPTQPRRVQHGLFVLAAPEPEKLELTLGKIRGLVGAENVGHPQLCDTHRPGAGPLAHFLPRLAFRHFRPPLEARVELDSATPKQIWTRVFRGRVVQIAGPWRSGGDWWNPDAWDRDEWDLALSDGALYRLCRDRQRKQWLVEGVYD